MENFPQKEVYEERKCSENGFGKEALGEGLGSMSWKNVGQFAPPPPTSNCSEFLKMLKKIRPNFHI